MMMRTCQGRWFRLSLFPLLAWLLLVNGFQGLQSNANTPRTTGISPSLGPPIHRRPAITTMIRSGGGDSTPEHEPKKNRSKTLSKAQCWGMLVLAIFLDTAGASLSKRSRDVGSVSLFLVAVGVNLQSMFAMNLALSRLPVGTAYAAWSAIGTLVVSAFGVFLFHESMTWVKATCLIMITMGVTGLNLLSNSEG